MKSFFDDSVTARDFLKELSEECEIAIQQRNVEDLQKLVMDQHILLMNQDSLLRDQRGHIEALKRSLDENPGVPPPPRPSRSRKRPQKLDL